jgi:uncharacterized protein
VASGSSSVEIHSHLKESLAGRALIVRVFPLSAGEIISAGAGSWHDYLRFGGLPGPCAVGEPQRKQELLQRYLSSYLLTDIKAVIREENVRAFNSLLYLLAQNQGQLIEVSSLAREVGHSSPTIYRYLAILDQTYVNFMLPCYSTNLGNEPRKSKKTYLYDLGMRNILLRDFRPPENRPDMGAILESSVFLGLRAALLPNMELRFWRTKRQEEIDFVLVVNRAPTPIEVKAALAAPQISPYLARFTALYPNVRETYTVSAKSFESVSEKDVRELQPLQRYRPRREDVYPAAIGADDACRETG